MTLNSFGRRPTQLGPMDRATSHLRIWEGICFLALASLVLEMNCILNIVSGCSLLWKLDVLLENQTFLCYRRHLL
jgi:hypothetical protein